MKPAQGIEPLTPVESVLIVVAYLSSAAISVIALIGSVGWIYARLTQ